MTNCIAGIDFGKTNVRFGISANAHELTYFAKRPYTRGSYPDMIRQIRGGIDEALHSSGYTAKDLRTIGICVPAVVNRTTGSIIWGPDWDFLAGASLTEPIREYYCVPVVADVDTVMPTWGELHEGIGKECKRFAILAWGTGLGAGLVIDGKVQEYPNSLFPEFGHSRVSDDDWPCKCGARGCVDTMVCGGGIARHGWLAVEQGMETRLRDMCENDPEKMTTQIVFQAAEEGDLAARGILNRVAALLGRLCANIVLTIQPEKIVINGGLSEQCHMVLPTINRTMRESCWLIFRGLTQCEVVASKLCDTAGVWGAISKARFMTG